VNGKLLIVEDEPIVALDLQQEVEELGFEVTGLAESAD
jgi:CheY-like chemotaxis protein